MQEIVAYCLLYHCVQLFLPAVFFSGNSTTSKLLRSWRTLSKTVHAIVQLVSFVFV